MSYSQLRINDFKTGIYLHYKNHLYEADHLTHNSSENNRIEIHYIGLQLSGAHEGPRHATREFNEFLVDQVHKMGQSAQVVVFEIYVNLINKLQNVFAT